MTDFMDKEATPSYSPYVNLTKPVVMNVANFIKVKGQD